MVLSTAPPPILECRADSSDARKGSLPFCDTAKDAYWRKAGGHAQQLSRLTLRIRRESSKIFDQSRVRAFRRSQWSYGGAPTRWPARETAGEAKGSFAKPSGER